MLARLFPAQFDRSFRGHRAALWILVPILLLKLLIGVNSIVIGRTVAQGADGIPLDTFGPVGADTVVALFALLGFAHVLLTLVGVLAFARYRSMVPLFYLLLVVDFVGRKIISLCIPIPRTGGASGGIITLVLLGLILAGFGGSLWRPRAA